MSKLLIDCPLSGVLLGALYVRNEGNSVEKVALEIIMAS